MARRVNSREVRLARSFGRRSVRAFTTIDVLVSISIVVLLISILLPSLARVKHTAHRVVCSSNIRQAGLGIALYTDAAHDYLPYSIYRDAAIETTGDSSIGEMMTLRLPDEKDGLFVGQWDGLGHLFGQDVLPTPEIFYCPAHTGDHPISRYKDQWLGDEGRIYGNYHYRGLGPNGETRLSMIEPSGSAIAADGMRTQADYNHKIGMNVLRADLSVTWYSDPLGELAAGLPANEGDMTRNGSYDGIWRDLDQGGSQRDDDR